MIEPSGNYRMLTDFKLPADAPKGSIFAVGTEQEIRAIAQRVKLGAAELDKRRSRRKAQRASRKANR